MVMIGGGATTMVIPMVGTVANKAMDQRRDHCNEPDLPNETPICSTIFSYDEALSVFLSF